MSAQDIVNGFNQARDMALNNPEQFPGVLQVVLQVTSSTDFIEVQQWTSQFLQEWFSPENTKLSFDTKQNEARSILPVLIKLSKVHDTTVYKNVVLTTTSIFEMIFDLVGKTSNDNLWYQLSDLKTFIISNWNSAYPLHPKDPDSDKFRSIGSRIAAIKLISKIIVIQTPPTVASQDPRRRVAIVTNNSNEISIANISDNHLLLKKLQLDAEAKGLMDSLLSYLKEEEYLVSQVFIAILDNLIFILQRRKTFAQKVFQVIANFSVDSKYQFPRDTFLKYKLEKRFVERAIKNALNYANKAGLVKSTDSISPTFQKIVTTIHSTHEEQKKKGILTQLPGEKPNKKLSKYQLFPNDSTTIEEKTYSALYQLIDSSNELIDFDVSQVPTQALSNVAIAALHNVDMNKLIAALSIVSARYTYLTNKTPKKEAGTLEVKAEEEALKNDDNDNERILNDENVEEVLDTTYILPPPKPLSDEIKKSHLKLIVKNFFSLANLDHDENRLNISKIQDDQLNSSLKISKIAINDWKKNSWLVLLTRLATRGLKNDENEDDNSDLIREAIFNYFLENIHDRVDIIIEWLNEEWFAELTKNSNDLDNDDGAEEDIERNTTNYLKWTDKVLDAMIPFLEANDRKIFIRLLSDLPYLNNSLISRVKSLCIDPQRSSLGFQSLQFLIMFRPPVKRGCIEILNDLYRNNEDLKEKAAALLKKYDENFKEEVEQKEESNEELKAEALN